MPCWNPSGADANEKLFMGLTGKPLITADTLVNGTPSHMWRLVLYKIITRPSSKVRVQMENIGKVFFLYVGTDIRENNTWRKPIFKGVLVGYE